MPLARQRPADEEPGEGVEVADVLLPREFPFFRAEVEVVECESLGRVRQRIKRRTNELHEPLAGGVLPEGVHFGRKCGTIQRIRAGLSGDVDCGSKRA